MTQSKDDDLEFDMTEEWIFDPRGPGPNDDTITINLDDTYGATTTLWSDSTISGDDTFTISTGLADTIDINWIYNNMNIDPNEVERMCQEYPSLEKTWRNFKSVYDMVKQDWEGKKKAGEVDDDIPF